MVGPAGQLTRQSTIALVSSNISGFALVPIIHDVSTNMPNQRQPGTKLAGAYISAEKDGALAKLAAKKGYANKAEFIRSLFDDAIAGNKQRPKPQRN